MPTIIKPVEPQPVLVDPKPPGRWIWGPTEPITDMCRKQADGKFGNSRVSWWNDDNAIDLNHGDRCPIERPPKAKVECVYDGDRWCWVVSFSATAALKWKKNSNE